MKTARDRGEAGAFSLIELLATVAIIGILAALLLPVLSEGKARVRRLACVSDLRQTGLAFQMFAQDHNGRFPMQVPIGGGGTMELVQNSSRIQGEFYFGYCHVQALSNELATPKVLVCPADNRPPALNFSSFNNSNLSYFVGVSADFSQPGSVLAGDRNITNAAAGASSLLLWGATQPLRWTGELHRFRGNLLYSDAHVEQRNTPGLLIAGRPGTPVAALALPSVRPPSSTPRSGLPGGSANSSASWSHGTRSEPGAATRPSPVATQLILLATNPAAGTNPPAPVVAIKATPTKVIPTNAPSVAAAASEEEEDPDLPAFVKQGRWLSYYILLVLAVAALVMAKRYLRRRKRRIRAAAFGGESWAGRPG